MELLEITELAEANFTELQRKVLKLKTNSDQVDKYIKQFDPLQHDTMDPTIRPDKLIQTDLGPSKVLVSRLGLSLQKQIVSMAVSFLLGNPVKLMCAPEGDIQEGLLGVFKKTWDDNKLDYDSKRIAKILMSETEVAELWYTEAIEYNKDSDYWYGTANEGGKAKFRLRMKVLARSLGDTIIPVFNSYGDMIAFARGYTVNVDGKNVEHFDVYTDDKIYLGVKDSTGFVCTPSANVVGKIPVIYYSQPISEWSDVQSLIDRFERMLSNHADTNDYFGSPLIKVKGEIKGFAKKGESGKILELVGGADAEYMSWDQSPKSVELEFKNLRSLIFDLTSTPDISIEQMKTLGTYSGIALKMLFLNAHLKASDKEETFGKGIQRRINYLKAAIAKINLDLKNAIVMNITPKFEYYLPKNTKEDIDILTTASGGNPIMSIETAVKLNPLVQDPDDEINKMKSEDNTDLPPTD